MDRTQIALLLGSCAARDQRTIGEADVLAWHDDLGDLDFADAREAVSMHYRESTERIMPAHVRRQVKILRDKRRPGSALAELLPGKFADDPDRDARIARNKARVAAVLAAIAAKRSIPDADGDPDEGLTPSEEIHRRALARAKDEKRTRDRGARW